MTNGYWLSDPVSQRTSELLFTNVNENQQSDVGLKIDSDCFPYIRKREIMADGNVPTQTDCLTQYR